jgi:tol-pal system protein YbgF
MAARSSILNHNARLLLTAGALCFMLSAAPATAAFSQQQDNSQLVSRLNQLENQVQTMSRAMYRGGPMPAASPSYSSDIAPGSAAACEDRMAAIEQRQREITGKLEQMQYDLQQMNDRMNRAAMDGATPATRGPSTAYNSGSTGATYVAPVSGGGSDRAVYNSNGYKSQVLGSMSSSGGSAAGSADSLYEEAFTDIRNAKYDSAAGKFRTFMGSYPTHSLASNAQYWLAETYYVRGDYRQSAKLFAQGYQDYPQGSKAPDSLLKLGLSLSRLGKKDDACLSFKQLKKDFPGEQTAVMRAAQQEMKQIGCAG